MIKKYSSLIAVVITLAVSYTENAHAQISGTEAYIKGNYVEIGIAGLGGYEGADMTTGPVPAGMHPRSGGTNFFGFVANPQMNGWASSAYDGDFFTPGSPENGWGIKIGSAGTTIATNNCEGNHEMQGVITSYTYTAPYYSVDWEGDDTTGGANLHIKINYLLDENAFFYTTTVWITNNSADTIPHLYFYRNVDPDNNESLTSNFVTTNTIVDQAPAYGGSTVATVSAVQYTPFTSYFSFIGDTTFKAGFGGFSNRDAEDMFNGVAGYSQIVSSTNTSDQAVYLASDIQNLMPGDTSANSHRSTVASNTRSFHFITSFDSTATLCAVRSMQVTQVSYPELSTTSSAIALLGSPAGGTFIGTGVSGTTFDPAVSGTGTFDIIYSYSDSTGCTGTAVSQIHVADVTTGFAANAMNARVSLYPNPFTDETTISVGASVKLENASVHIYDVLGKEVKVVAANSNEIKIDRKGLAGGMYFYKLINNNQQIASGKMMIK
ncbi:MAG: hypothetical protein JWP12_152 [Bacteroidetes bacterium]|nr:hypothetical protein [Bacteroidota bacterium]